MENTGEQREMEVEVVVVGGSGEHDTTDTSGNNSNNSSSHEEEENAKVSYVENSAIKEHQPHLHTVVDIEQCEGAPCRRNANSGVAAAEVGSAANPIASTSKEIRKRHQVNPNKLNSELCDDNYNYRNLPQYQQQQRSKSLPLGKRQATDSSNFVDSSEITTTIREYTSEQSNSVSGVLNFCKRRVLFPYLKLLAAVGFRPLYTDGNDGCVWTLVVSRIYLCLVGIVLIMGYALQFMTCFRRDLGFYYKESIRNPPSSLSSSYDYHFGDSVKKNLLNATRHAELLQLRSEISDKEEEMWFLEKTICSGNMIYVYIVPSILHLVSFIYMVYLYWIYDDEHLQNLMERVFIQAAHANINYFSQRRLIRRLQSLVTVGCIWILLISACQFMQVYLSKIYFNIWIEVEYNATYAVSAVLLFATLWHDAIQITIVISFAIHCNLICTYTELIKGRLMQHSITLSECMKELGELGKLLSYLNDDLALGLAPLLFIDGAYATGAVVQLVRNGKHLSVPILSLLVVSAVLWIFVIVFSLSNAAKVSTCCQQLKDMGHLIRIRPFGYQFVAQFDLDSFLLYTSNLHLKARILKVPITTPILSSVAIALSFSALLWGYFH